MNEVLEYLEERGVEFERHLFVARLLQGRVGEEPTADEQLVEVRHVNTLKSGLLIHLYNIVEAVTVRTLKVVGETIITEKPKLWSDKVMREWIRASVWDGTDRLGDGVVKRLVGISGALASGEPPPEFNIKGEPGSWNDTAIKAVADRLGCQIVLPDDIARAAYEKVYRDEKTAMRYLADRRNAIAHGEATFEDGAGEHTLDDIKTLAARILPYLKGVTGSYAAYLESKAFLVSQTAPAPQADAA